ncbi:helix-turn-helix domain-containing protein, partial [Micromonospora sp. NPDC000207]|uniref:helix-turn-helix domain-containing protein n=1 Tax=Micromonospora sp. NPDC000207 TaxID=3154246 RepID=UPI003322BC7A
GGGPGVPGGAAGGGGGGGWGGGGGGGGGGGPRRAGRPRAMSPEQVTRARRMYADGTHSVDAIATHLGVSRATVYRHLPTAD